MKKLLLVAALAISTSLGAQIKNVNQIVVLSSKTYNEVAAAMEKSYWKKFEDGKMDSLTYTRWVPAVGSNTNVGDNVMCFYKKKDRMIDYIVLQTANVAFRNQCRAEVKKAGYKLSQHEKNKGEEKESYLKGKVNVTIFQGKQNPTDPVTYLIGSKII